MQTFEISAPGISNKIETNNYGNEMHAVPMLETSVHQLLLHSIRNPLANIEMCVYMLKTAANPGDIELYLNIISRNNTIVKNIINHELLAFDNIAGKHSLNKIVDDTLEMAQDRIVLHHIDVQKNYAADIGECMLVQSEIKTALLNIIINAVEAMGPENGKLNVTTKVNRHTCDIIIKDNGIGVSKQNMAKLFKPFYTSKSTGIGLGLATSLAIFQSHKATVKVKSTQHGGTSFTVSFNKISNKAC